MVYNCACSLQLLLVAVGGLVGVRRGGPAPFEGTERALCQGEMLARALHGPLALLAEIVCDLPLDVVTLLAQLLRKGLLDLGDQGQPACPPPLRRRGLPSE